MPVKRPGPKSAHVIVEIPIVERPGSLFPLLILSDGNPSLITACYARDLQRANFSPKKILEAVAAVGRLYDFYQIKLKGAAQELREQRLMLKQFAEARLHGTTQPNGGADPSGLNWRPVKLTTVKKDLGYVSDFSRWVANNFGGQELNPLEEKYVSSVREAYETSIQMHSSVFAHLLPARAAGQSRPQFELNNDGGAHLRDVPKSFPPDKIVDLIEAASNPRDKMGFILMAFGSLRISETTHIYLEDVASSFRDTKASYVALGHPTYGYYRWVDSRGRQRSGMRAQYLMEMYGRVPRNSMFGTEQYAGWKGMEFGDRKVTGFVHWIREEAGLYFRQLLHRYFKEVFSGKPEGWPGHPYLFVKTDRHHFGEPMTIANLANQFYAACAKIGLDPRDPGVNPHGLRHFYGFFCADILGIKLEHLQKQMHHADPLSTNVYYHVSQLKVRDHLLSAQSKVGRQSLDDAEGRPAQLADRRVSTRDPFGLLDYFRRRVPGT